MENVKLQPTERLDDLLTNNLRIIQSEEVFSFSMDAILLAHFCSVPVKGAILDLCTGNGVVPLLLTTRTRSRIWGVEIQERLADMAKRNVKLNGLQDQLTMLHGDLKEVHQTLGYGNFDLVTVNPPYLPVPSGEISGNAHFAAARHEVHCTLEDVAAACSRLVRPGGKAAMVHRPHRLADIVCLMRKYRLEPKRIRYIHPRQGEEANMVLIEAIRDGKPEIRTLPPLIVYTEEGVYCKELMKIYYGGVNAPVERSRSHDAEGTKKSYEEHTAGTLYLVGTPIGNLEDMTYRAIRILGEVKWIAAEDTRQTRKLLTHYDISTRLVSYHEHNKQASGPELIRLLLTGESIALVSDAGLPAISDPGCELVQLAVEHEIPVVPVPGANAALSALIISGLPTDKFTFIGFLPRDNKTAASQLEELKSRRETLILYESPHRISKTLEKIKEAWGDRPVAVTRELTKRFEEVARGTVTESLERLKDHPPLGEYCIIVGGFEGKDSDERGGWWENLSLAEHVERYMADGLDRKDAMKQTAKERGLSKRDVYNELLGH